MRKVIFVLLFCLILTQVCFAKVALVGSLSRESEVKPGERIEGVFTLRNNGDKPEEVDLYQKDYIFYADGRNDYIDPGSVKRSNANWISLSANRIIVPPFDTVPVTYTIQIPNDPEIKGTYWSMIMVEPMGEPPTSIKHEPGKAKLGVRTMLRYGVQIITNIEDTGERKIKFLDKSIVTRDGKKYFKLDVENIGERSLSPYIAMELYDNEGNIVGRYEGDKLRIYPGCSASYMVELGDVPKGNYKSLILLDNKDEYVFGAQYDLAIE
ncbi:MAG: hypothetical protein ABIH00_00055 [Armatimonadota bacterium]